MGRTGGALPARRIHSAERRERTGPGPGAGCVDALFLVGCGRWRKLTSGNLREQECRASSESLNRLRPLWLDDGIERIDFELHALLAPPIRPKHLHLVDFCG